MGFDVGCELSSRGKRNLRYAIGAILVAIAAPVSASDDARATLDPVVVNGLTRVPINLVFALNGGNGGQYGLGFDTDIPQDVYDQTATAQSGSPEDSGRGCDKVPRSNPITLANANKLEVERDFQTQDLEMPLYFERTYSKNTTVARDFRGDFLDWNTNLDYYAGGDPVTGEDISVSTPWKILRFSHEGNGVYRNGGVAKLVWSASEKVLTHYTESNTIERYQRFQWPSGRFAFRILSLTNERGVGWNYSYGSDGRRSAVTHTSGKKIQFFYDSTGVSVVDPGGRTYRYNYSQPGWDGVLSEARFPDGEIRQYHYSGGLLTGKSFNGVRYSTFGWKHDPNSISMVPISSEHAGGVDRWEFDFTFDPNNSVVLTATEKNPLGKMATYEFDHGALLRVTGHPSPNCSGTMVSSITYENGRKNIVTDADGGVTDFDFDGHGHLLRKVEAPGRPEVRTTTFVWDEANNRLLKETVSGDHETSAEYFSNGLVASVTQVDLKASIGSTRVTTYRYTHHPNGVLATATVDGPMVGTGDSITTSYSQQGNLTSISNGAGHTTSYANHTALGQPGKVTSPAGAVTEYEYDTRGRTTVERTWPSGVAVETRYVYGVSGLLEGIVRSDGSSSMYRYDAARRLVEENVTSPDGGYEVRKTHYNAMSLPIKVEVGRDN